MQSIKGAAVPKCDGNVEMAVITAISEYTAVAMAGLGGYDAPLQKLERL